MALRLLKSALSQPRLTRANAIAIVKYHLRRNGVARNSHTKSWHRRHKTLGYKVLL
jgi:hypothetical protein